MIFVIMAVLAVAGCTYLYLEQQKLAKKYKKIASEKKSGEVRMGYLTEHLAPLLKEFPYDVQSEDTILIPLGQPIDFVVVTPTEIGFVEIKTGVAQLNKNQQLVKKLVEGKQIKWHCIRIKEH